MMLLLSEGKATKEVADSLHLSDDTVRYWHHRYLSEGMSGLYTRARKGRPPKLLPEAKELILKSIRENPRTLGINSSNWTCELLAYFLHRETGIRITREAIRRFLHKEGFALKRPSPIVISPDPEYEHKKGNLRGWSPTI
jgi:transposase